MISWNYYKLYSYSLPIDIYLLFRKSVGFFYEYRLKVKGRVLKYYVSPAGGADVSQDCLLTSSNWQYGIMK